MQRFGLEKATATTPQSQKIKGRENEMRKNNAGGFSFRLDRWKRLERFLILGTEGGTYYVTERKLDQQNTTNLTKCLESDWKATIDMIVAVSHEGRAIKNDPAIFALAFCASKGNVDAKKYAFKNLQKVCRIGTHLFHFIEYAEAMRGWGSGMRKAVAKWYTDKKDDTLALQLLKYKQRDGWAHRDLLRLSHPSPLTEVQSALFKCAVGKEEVWPTGVPICDGYNKVTAESNLQQCVKLVKDYELPRELLGTHLLNEPAIWEAMLPSMPMTALIRNLGKMASLGMFDTLSSNIPIVVNKLVDEEAIRKSRVHPISIFIASRIYAGGSNVMGAQYGREMKWKANGQIIAALNKAFYLSFKNVIPSGKNILLALDVSGSMTDLLSGTPISCRDATGLMAMVTARTEPNYGIIGFTAKGENPYKNRNRRHGYGDREGVATLSINPTMDLETIIRNISGLPFGSTDCSLPMIYAMDMGIRVDTFVIYTDNETWFGDIHPVEAMSVYRKSMNPDAKLVVVGMTATNFSIADPEDAGMLDVVGFDTNTPSVISDFAA